MLFNTVLTFALLTVTAVSYTHLTAAKAEIESINDNAVSFMELGILFVNNK